MKTLSPWHTLLARALTVGALAASIGCAPLDNGYSGGSYYGNDRYDEGYYDRRRYDNYDDYDRRRDWERDRVRDERREVERERDRLEEERRRIERERDAARRPSSPAPREERCPSGFSPSEDKCSPQERRRGCKDIRLPGGLGCVKR